MGHVPWRIRQRLCNGVSGREGGGSKRKHGVGLDEAQEIFDHVYVVDQRSDSPEQFRAIGWSRGRLCSVMFEVRRDATGEYYRLITAWIATRQEEQTYVENA